MRYLYNEIHGKEQKKFRKNDNESMIWILKYHVTEFRMNDVAERFSHRYDILV